MYYFHIFNQHLTSNMSYKCIIQLNILHILQWDNLSLAIVSILLLKTKRCSVLLQVFTQIYLLVCILAIIQTCLHYMLQADNWFKPYSGSEGRCVDGGCWNHLVMKMINASGWCLNRLVFWVISLQFSDRWLFFFIRI